MFIIHKLCISGGKILLINSIFICFMHIKFGIIFLQNQLKDFNSNKNNRKALNVNIPNAATIPSNVDENQEKISDDEFIRNVQMSSDSTDDLNNVESYQMADEIDIETDSDRSYVNMPFENPRTDDENNCLQNIPNYDDNDDDENNRQNNVLEQVCFKILHFLFIKLAFGHCFTILIYNHFNKNGSCLK